MASLAHPLRIGVGVATAARPAILREMLAILREQTRPPDRLVICAPLPDDVGDARAVWPAVEVRTGVRGLPKQRNVILEACRDCDLVVFFDDDFFPSRSYLAHLETIHAAHPEIAMTTGTVLLDGVTRGGIPVEAGRAALETAGAAPIDILDLSEVHNGYGCNMSVSMRLAGRHGVRFDERLPLYGWLEDVDFSRSLALHGRIVRAGALRGIHLGTKSGRQPGTRLGYSQVANPIFIYRKGNLSFARTLLQIGRNMTANLARFARPEPFVDRRGRLRGNLIGLKDLASGRLLPERALEL